MFLKFSFFSKPSGHYIQWDLKIVTDDFQFPGSGAAGETEKEVQI